jgi:hypothetical protein
MYNVEMFKAELSKCLPALSAEELERASDLAIIIIGEGMTPKMMIELAELAERSEDLMA